MNKTPHLNRLWLLLLAATVLTWWLGEAGAVASPLSGTWAVPLIFGLAVFKGRLVILDFMELRGAPALWRRLLLGWLFGVVALILLAWWMARA
jgi:caa(3)-type oxidase subunit IV